MDRLSKFNKLKEHAWLGRLFKKLKKADLDLCEAFIADNAHLDKGAFEFAVNRMFINKPKPKYFTIILELLTCSNS